MIRRYITFAALLCGLMVIGALPGAGQTFIIPAQQPTTRFSCFVQAVTVTTQCQAAPAAGLRNYVSTAILHNQVATAKNVDIVYGTGANCVTGITAISHKIQMGTNALTTSPFGPHLHFDPPLIPATASAICLRPSAATAFGATVTGYVAP